MDNMETAIDNMSHNISPEEVVKGVLFTRDIAQNRPYYMIVCDEQGLGKTKWIAKNTTREFLSERCYNLVKTAREIEDTFPETDAFSIEFTIDVNEKINVIRYSPLDRVVNMARPTTDKEFADTKSFAKCGYLDTSHILSDCVFWNPLDKLGTNPRPLDYSLFRETITNGIWSKAISDMGYTLVDKDVMQKVGNKPYMSVNYIVEGLMPSSIDGNLGYKLYQYYEKRLKEDKRLHAKMEQKLVFNKYDFSTDRQLQELLEYGFTEEELDELRAGLFDITMYLLQNYKEINKQDEQALDKLKEIRKDIRAQLPYSETNTMKLYKHIEELLNATKEFVASQYARQTRISFVARCLCESLVEEEYFEEDVIAEFRDSISTVASELKRDLKRYSSGKLSKDEFNDLYGHLKSGIFDIRTDCFKRMKFDTEIFSGGFGKEEESIPLEIKYPDKKILGEILSNHNISVSVDDFLDFIVVATRNKDYFKFEFTKTMSLMLDVIVRMGEILGIAREDMSYLEIQDLLSYHSRDSYIQIIQTRRDMYHMNTYLLLPDIIFDIGDIDVIEINRKVKI